MYMTVEISKDIFTAVQHFQNLIIVGNFFFPRQIPKERISVLILRGNRMVSKNQFWGRIQ